MTFEVYRKIGRQEGCVDAPKIFEMYRGGCVCQGVYVDVPITFEVGRVEGMCQEGYVDVLMTSGMCPEQCMHLMKCSDLPACQVCLGR